MAGATEWPQVDTKQEDAMRVTTISRVRWFALVALMALLVAACGGGTEGTGTSGESETTGSETGSETGGESEAAEGGSTADLLVVGTTEKPSTLDPAEAYELMASNFLFSTTEQLVRLKPGTDELEGGIAESWEISDDATEFTFKLREGVKFHDGSDLTSEDVKYSLERSRDINHPDGAAFLVAPITKIDTPDDYTVKITIADPNVTFIKSLAYTVGSIIPSDSDTYPAKPGKLLGKAGEPPSGEQADKFITKDQIVGSGPYQLTDYSPDTGGTLEAFPDYWGEAPVTPTVKVQFFESAAQMTNALKNGEIDLNINDLGPAERASLEQTEGVTVEAGEGGRIRYIIIDTEKKPFDDVNVRRAMAASIDRQKIIDEVFEGAGEPIYSMIPPSYEAYKPYFEDLEAPESLPGEPVDIDLWYPLNKYGDTEPDLGEQLGRQLNDSGFFNVTTKSADYDSEYSNNLGKGSPYGAYLLGWYPDYIDPDDYIYPFYLSTGFIGHYRDPDMDKLIKQEQREPDEAKRVEIFDEIQKKAAEDVPFIPLYQETPNAYYLEGVTGVEFSIDVAQQARWWLIGKSE